MRAAALALAAAALLALAPPAGAVTLVTSDGVAQPQPFQRWADRAAVATPPGSVVLSLGSCLGSTTPCAGESGIWFSPDLAWDRRMRRMAFLHELGHVYDRRVLTDRRRDRFRAITHDPRPWHYTYDETGAPLERFGVAYSWCAMRVDPVRERHLAWSGESLDTYGYRPTRRSHARACRMIGPALAAAASCRRVDRTVVVRLDNWRHRHVLDHVWDSWRRGQPVRLHIARRQADANRAASLLGVPTRAGYDRDEYPPAMADEGGRGADVRYVRSSENRSAGAVMGDQLQPYCNGQRFRFERPPR